MAQAISRLRAEQSKVWHVRREGDQEAAKRSVRYDRQAIQHYIDESKDHMHGWQSWFHQNNIVPLRLNYEDLDVDGESVAHEVLDFIGVDHPSSRINARNVRMADKTSTEWAERFRAETGYSD